MIAYKLFWLLKTEEYLYLMTGKRTEFCSIAMTAAKPKKVSRIIDLEVDPDDTFLMYQARCGHILWSHPVSFRRDDGGKLQLNVTDLLRQLGLDFTFCEPGVFRSHKARTWELWDFKDKYSWGFMDAREGFALESASNATLSFFPGSCHICGAEICSISLAGFQWSPQELYNRVRSLESPFHVDGQAVCRCLEEQGPLTDLTITGSRIRIATHMFFMTFFQVEGFGGIWKRNISPAMFQENGCAPCKTHRFGPLLCRLLEAEDADAVEQALQWAVEADILK